LRTALRPGLRTTGPSHPTSGGSRTHRASQLLIWARSLTKYGWR